MLQDNNEDNDDNNGDEITTVGEVHCCSFFLNLRQAKGCVSYYES